MAAAVRERVKRLRLTDLACPPRWSTKADLSRPTYGPRIAEIAEWLGKPLMPHQRYMAEVASEIDPATGRPAYSRILLVGPRQVTGKTEFILPYMTHRCIADWPGTDGRSIEAQRVVYTAQTADDSREKWRDVHLPRLQAADRVAAHMLNPRLRLNAEAIRWKNGSMWMPKATTSKKSGTGDFLDLAVIDEAWSRPDGRTELGLRPAMMTRPASQLLVASMVPGITRAAPGTWPWLENLMKVGKAQVEADRQRGQCTFIWAAEDDADPADPRTWWSCMPGLGITVQESVVADDQDNLDEVDFGAEYLGWIPKQARPRWKLIRAETWKRLEYPDSQLVGSPALAVVMDDDRQHAVIVAAGRSSLGPNRIHTEVIEPGQDIPSNVVGVDWVERRLVDMVAGLDPCAVVIDRRRAEASLIVPLQNRGIEVLTPNVLETGAACGRWYDYTGEEPEPTLDPDEIEAQTRLVHIGQDELMRSLEIGVKFDLGSGSFTFVKRGTASVLINLYGSALAVHGFEVAGGNDYDVADSIDWGHPCPRCSFALYREGDTYLHASNDSPECER